jgi:hypothetical protein
MGVLLLEDWTVVQVMLTAIAVGALGVHVLHTLGRAEWKLGSTNVAAHARWGPGLRRDDGWDNTHHCPR